MKIRTIGWAAIAGLTLVITLLLGIQVQAASAEKGAAIEPPPPPGPASPLDGAAPQALNATWSITRVDTAGDVGPYTALALDASWESHIAYYDAQSGTLRYARRVVGEWLVQTVDDSGDVGQYAAIALDWFDQPAISYYDATRGALKVAQWTGSDWLIQTVDDGGDVGTHTSLAFDSENNPHVSYYDVTQGALNYAIGSSSGWSTKTLDSSGDVGQYTDLAMNAADEYRISYYDVTHGDLKFAYLDGIQAKIVQADAGGNDVGKYTSLALNRDEHPLISYYDETDDSLKLASWVTSTWITQRMNAAGAGGRSTSLALDNSDDPHISYADTAHNHLRLLWWTGSRWLTETVDSGPLQYASLALDRNENPHISYYEGAPHDDLKYAYVPTTPSIDFRSSRYDVGEGDGSILITVTLSTVSVDQAAVDYATVDGTATAGADYLSANGTLTFPPGTTAQSFSVAVLQDAIDEHDETVRLTLSNPRNARLGDSSSAELTVLDDDAAPEVAFDLPTYTVQEDEGAVTLTVVLSQTSGLTITVDYASGGSGDTATPGEDYTPISGTLVFTPGITLHTLGLTIKEDDDGGGEETISVHLENVQHATIGANNPAIVTITDLYEVYLPLVVR
jgi:hypothetical protein